MLKQLVYLLLLAGCGTSSAAPAPQADRSEVKSSTPPAPEEFVKAATPEPKKEAGNPQLQCATLAASYTTERNALFGGDRQTLKQRLTEVGNQYRERMAQIPGCSFPIP